ncbi:MAG: hypothetical protein OXG94_00795 [Bacteroidetes bacterium]|nr:hypothetical protein [Bacteroidota bacterium]
MPKHTIPSLDDNIAAYEQMQDILEAKHMYKWVVFYNEKLVDVFDSLDLAAFHATQKFGKGPFLIRQVGMQKPARMSSHLQYGFNHA